MRSDPEEKPFAEPVAIDGPDGTISIASARQALDFLSSTDWPAERDQRHRDACDACLKVIDGHRSTEDARNAFVAVAREAGILSS